MTGSNPHSTTLDEILDKTRWGDYQAPDGRWGYGISNRDELKAALHSYLTHKIIEELDNIIQDGALQGEWVSVEWLKQRRAKLRKEVS